MKYTKEFKEEALKLTDEIGVRKAAEQLGLKYNTLTDWRKQRKEQQSQPQLSEAEQARRIRELEQELAELKRANDILKDALGFFAKDRKK
jgi:transposase